MLAHKVLGAVAGATLVRGQPTVVVFGAVLAGMLIADKGRKAIGKNFNDFAVGATFACLMVGTSQVLNKFAPKELIVPTVTPIQAEKVQ